MADLRDSEFHLNRALSQARATSVAIGVLMERHRLDEDAAFQMLRAKARASRRKLADLAEELVRAAELLSASPTGSGAQGGRRSRGDGS